MKTWDWGETYGDDADNYEGLLVIDFCIGLGLAIFPRIDLDFEGERYYELAIDLDLIFIHIFCRHAWWTK